ncbi:MRS7 family protein [Aspergillus fumigatus Af293]|uniref:MRS7 family protein n=2 Tax=Aspergillus fumigatus TaxID=746128 RepID=Q4WX50_ASPFU|nr:MRS7 family protein [Aspergillus fumigatus Af293]EAL92753.1 MRS7 family protein [Aspergillus fumigatus Af293]EDP52915.1 MRS7 family protein [Aspergillus fumigatus A1163]
MGLRRVLNDIITSNFDCHTYSSSARLKPLRDQDYNSLRDCCAPSAILARHPEHFMPLDFGNVRHNEIGQAYAHQFFRPRYTGALGAASAANLRFNERGFPTHLQAIAILVSHQRGYATETSTSTSSPSNPLPPPGFNAEQAKKPIPKEDVSRLAADNGNTQVAPKSETPLASENSVDVQKRAELEAAKKGLADDDKKVTEAKKEQKKLTIGQKIKKEVQHYWDGTKLLATEVRISSRLALKMAAGYELSRREYRQLQRTVKDLGRLIPFSMFVIIPFAELLLPVALKLFPNLLPSTYEGQKAREKKALNLSSTRQEVSTFLKNTLRESGLPVTPAAVKNEEFGEFFKKIRTTGETPSTEDVIKVCKIFKDDLTLDNLSRPQLVAICKYMNLNSFGTDAMLRYNIRHRMRQIKRDDRAIFYEGVDSLSVPELQMACASRGIRTHGISPARLREDLAMWLDLRLKQGVPSTLLVLSNAYAYAQGGKEAEMASQIEALKSVLSSIPEELFHEIELEVHNAEGAATNKQRLEVIKEQQELIEEENEQNSKHEEKGVTTPKDIEDIDETEDAKFEASNSQEKQSNEAVEAEKEGDKAEQTQSEDLAAKEKEEKKGGSSQ